MPPTAAPPTADVHRLSDIVTEEVSLVDKAANGRPSFLVIKRDPMQPLHANPDGTFSTTPPAPAPPPAAAPAPAPTTKAAVKLTSATKTALGQVVAAVLDMVTAAKSSLDSAEEVGSPDEEDPGDMLDALLNASDLLEDSVEALTEGAATDPMESPTEGDPPMEKSLEPLAKRLELRKAARVLTKADLKATVTERAKALYRRMGKKRLQRFEKALEMFSSLYTELTPIIAAAKALPKPNKPGKPAAPAACKADETPAAAPPPSPGGVDVAALTKKLAELEKSNASLRAFNVELQKRADIAKAARPLPAATPVDAANPPVPPAATGGEQPQWKDDMAPAGRHAVRWSDQ